MTPILILLRHGQSTWNLENKFTGAMDVELSLQGVEEAKKAGMLLKKFSIDTAFSSVLKRAVHTLDLVLEQREKDLPTIQSSAALNERNYGELQGLDKKEMEEKYSPEQVLKWRRGYDVTPPGGESLKDTYNRVIPFYRKEIEPKLKTNKNILVVAHGNSLRALMMFLEDISVKEIEDVNIATGIPRVYEYNLALNLRKVHYID